MAKKFYVNSKELEEWWGGWNHTKDDFNWEKMSNLIYLMCQGISRKFHPRTDEEFFEHAQDAYAQTMEKIKSGRLKFDPGRAPVFNLLTTTIYRILYSKMNKIKKSKEHHNKYTLQVLQKYAPEQLSSVEQTLSATY